MSMRKTAKRLFAALAALVMAFAVVTPAFAAEGTGTITITNAVVCAHGVGVAMSSCPAIGSVSMLPTIVINGSIIHAYRGNQLNPDYIGQGALGITSGSGLIQGDIKSSTIYKYTYDWASNTSTEDGIVDYNDQGVGTERPRP